MIIVGEVNGPMDKNAPPVDLATVVVHYPVMTGGPRCGPCAEEERDNAR